MLVPPNFDPAPNGFPEARSTAASLKSALEKADPGRVVYLSTIGAQAHEANLLTPHTMIEQVLGELAMLDYFPSTGVVHGEFSLGCRRGAR